MANCSICGEEIIGKVYSRLKYKWPWRIFLPVKYCKYCYQENQDKLEGVPPAFIAFLPILVAVMVIVLLVVGR